MKYLSTAFVLLGVSLTLLSCSNEQYGGPERLTDISFEEKLSIVGDGSDPETEFLRPFRVQTGPDDNIYVAGYSLPHVYVYNQEGVFINRFAKSGRGPGELLELRGLSIVDSTVYLWDRNLQRLSQFDLNGEFKELKRLKGVSSSIKVFRLSQNYLLIYPDRYEPPMSEAKLAHVYDNDFTEVTADFLRVDVINSELEEINRLLTNTSWMNVEIISDKQFLFVPHIYTNTIFEYTLEEDNGWNLSSKYKGLFNRDAYSLTDEERGRSPDFSHYSAYLDEPIHVITHNQSRGIFKVQDYIIHFVQVDNDKEREFGAEVFTEGFTPVGFIPIKSISITTEERNSLGWFVDEADEQGNFYFREVYADSSRIRKMHLDLGQLPK